VGCSNVATGIQHGLLLHGLCCVVLVGGVQSVEGMVTRRACGW